jgi:hypothetical protein
MGFVVVLFADSVVYLAVGMGLLEYLAWGLHIQRNVLYLIYGLPHS